MMEQKTLEKEFSSGIPVPLPISKVRIEAIILLTKHIFICIFYQHLPPNTTNISDLIRENPTNMLDWLPEREPQVQLLNFLDSNDLLPLRYLYWIGKKNNYVTLVSISFCWLICYNHFGFLHLPL